MLDDLVARAAALATGARTRRTRSTRHVDVDADLRMERLVDHHERPGRTRAAALQWAERTDEPNARLVEATRGRADLVVPLA